MGHHPGNKYMVRTEAIPNAIFRIIESFVKERGRENNYNLEVCISHGSIQTAFSQKLLARPFAVRNKEPCEFSKDAYL